MVQHCTAGKDRVGVGVAILLLLLGVDEETVLDDYLLSNDCRLSFHKLEQVSGACLSETQRETFAALTMAQFSYLSAFIETLKVAYGTAELICIGGFGTDGDRTCSAAADVSISGMIEKYITLGNDKSFLSFPQCCYCTACSNAWSTIENASTWLSTNSCTCIRLI